MVPLQAGLPCGRCGGGIPAGWQTSQCQLPAAFTRSSFHLHHAPCTDGCAPAAVDALEACAGATSSRTRLAVPPVIPPKCHQQVGSGGRRPDLYRGDVTCTPATGSCPPTGASPCLPCRCSALKHAWRSTRCRQAADGAALWACDTPPLFIPRCLYATISIATWLLQHVLGGPTTPTL